MLTRIRMRGAWSVLAILALTGTAAPAQPSCPGTATLTVFAENLSAASTIDVALEGELAADAATCVGTGATSYRETMACMGSGTVRCGQLGALQPGAWVHRLAVTVPGSAPQQQAQRLVLVAGSPTEASNALSWTIYPKTFVVEDTTETSLRAQLAAAAAYPGPTLVTFARTAFPGRSASRTIDLARGPCDPEPLRHAALCFTGSRVVVDALDADGEPGAVVWSVGTRALSLLRVYGSDNVFRGLLFEGSRTQQNSAQPTCPYAPAQPTCPDPTRPNCPDPAKPDCPTTKPDCQVDTVAITGSKARRNRIEHSLVVGPTCGDALSVDSDAGQPDDQGPGDNVIVESRITGAADRGVKVDFGGFATIERSCLHDNRNGGILSTLGGHVVAAENVVQHNVPGRAQNGITVGGPAPQSTLATDGNVVRLSGDRGLSVVNNASATFQNDYVADSQFAGSKVETTADGAADATPVATFHGVALVCNRHGNLTGTCNPSPCDCELPVPCSTPEDCCTNPDGTLDAACAAMTKCETGSLPRGAGAVTAAAPNVSYGDALEPGRNAFAANKKTSTGANFQVMNVDATIPAEGNQWEHCGSGAVCDPAAVRAQDIYSSPSGAMVAVGLPRSPRAGTPVLSRVSPARPQAGDIVRIFGDDFNAIEGSPLFVDRVLNCADLPVCADDGSCPTGPCVNGSCPCSIANPAVQLANKQTNANRIRIKAADGTLLADATGEHDFWPDAVTPTMLAFRMPFDCFAPLVLEVAKRDPSGSRIAATIPLCDPKGCMDEPAGTPCDDGNACTVNDACDGGGNCRGGAPLVCDGPCLICDPAAGCVPKVCSGACLTGTCDPHRGCDPKPTGAVCRPAAGPCDVGELCDGVNESCPADALRDVSTVCRPAAGPCDVAETCTGSSAECPLDRFMPPRTECRPAAGVCDAAEHCTGTSATCPGDVKRRDICRPVAGPCDVAESCDGLSNDCPPDRFKPAIETCDDGDPCTVGDHCTGEANVCRPGDPPVCDRPCLAGDPRAGCRHRECANALTCRAKQCSRPKMRPRLQKLELIINHALAADARLRIRTLRRFAKLLERCGVTVPGALL